MPGVGLVGPFIAFTLIAVIVLAALRITAADWCPCPAFAWRAGQPTPLQRQFHSRSRPRPHRADEDDEQGGASGAVAAKITWGDRRDAAMAGCRAAGGGHAQAAVMGIIGFLILDRRSAAPRPRQRARPDRAGADGQGGGGGSGGSSRSSGWGRAPRACGAWAWPRWARPCCRSRAISTRSHWALILASLGFGMFRPGFTSGASLAVSRVEQGQSAGIVASVNGAAYIFAPAIRGLALWPFAVDRLCRDRAAVPRRDRAGPAHDVA